LAPRKTLHERFQEIEIRLGQVRETTGNPQQCATAQQWCRLILDDTLQAQQRERMHELLPFELRRFKDA
jgi:hypothetical protein